MWFHPATEGTAAIRAQPRAFVVAFVRRLGAGLLTGAPHPRSQYETTREGADHLAFRAKGWWTAINVGLNEVELTVLPEGRVRYAISYWRWAGYAASLCGALGVFFIIFFLTFDIRAYLERHPSSMFPGLSMDQNVAIGWAMALFWGFAWPWILVAMHKRPLRRFMERIIAEVDGTAERPETAAR